MIKVGCLEIKKRESGGPRTQCRSCGNEATERVTFGDNYEKLVINLCDNCAGKDYFELLLQVRFSWPVKSCEEV